MKKLIVSNIESEISGFCLINFQEFGQLKLSEVIEYNKIVFVFFEEFSQKEATLVNCTAAMPVEVYVLCSNPDKCLEKFNVLNINNSKHKIQFVPDLPLLD
jgi:hypothetical protein